MIEEAIIYSIAIIIIVVILKGYFIKVTKIEAEMEVARANAYAGAQRAGALAEAGAYGFASEANEGGGGMDIAGILNLLQNPAVAALLEKFQKK